MGCDAMGNRYYENRIDYPWGQQRWVEPADINNFDATHIPPEWHGWMHHMNDATPLLEEEYIQEKLKHVNYGEVSHNPYKHNIGHQEPYFNFHGMHNQSQVRSRGYNIGNPIVGLPPGAPDAYYTQPGSPYNPSFMRTYESLGDLDEASGGGRPYKSEMWRKRLMTPEEIEAEEKEQSVEPIMEDATHAALSPREMALQRRGGTRRA
mmetsp:Transcript_10428/g.28828  ORF Transcript_10428/g.28828 Transcript_10428/m.28828 type:complete len:207 (-) Transcript_10428:206-826(-)